MADGHKNFAYSTVATAPSPASSGTSLVVAAGGGALFPTPPFNVTIWPTGVQPLASNAEVARCTGVSTDTFTIVRAQEGSSARTVVVGDQIAATITAKTITDVELGWFNVQSYGATGDGVTDDTTAIQAAITAMPAGGATLFFPAGTYLVTSALTALPSGSVVAGAGRSASTVKGNSTNDLWTLPSGLNKCAFQDITFTTISTAGHIFTPAGSVNTSVWQRVQAIQNNPAKSIWNGGDFGYIDNLWLGCVLTHNGATSVPSFNIVTNTNGANSNTWMRCQCNHVATGAATFFNIERDAAAAYNYNNTFRDLTFEICNGGMISLLSANACLIDNCNTYDLTTTTANLITIGAGSGGQASRSNTIRGYHRVSGALGASLNDIALTTGGKAIATTIQDCNQSSGAGITVDLGSNQRGLLIDCENATIANKHQSTIIMDRGRVICETVQTFVKAGAPVDGDFNVTPGDGSLAFDSTAVKLWARIGGTWQGVPFSLVWAPSTPYVVGQIITHDPGTGPILYQSTANFTSPGTFNTTNLVQVAVAPGAVILTGSVPFSQPLAAIIGTSGAWTAPASGTITTIRLSCVGAPAGSALTVDFLKNGAFVTGTQATSELSIPAGSTTVTPKTPGVAFSAADTFAVQATSVGSGTAATGVVAQIDYSQVIA